MNVRDLILTDVVSAYSVALSANERKEMRRRPTYGLTYALSGEIVYKQDKRACTSDSRHLLLLPKGQTYSLLCTESGLFPVVNFDIVSAQAWSHILDFPIHADSDLGGLFQQLEAQAKSGGEKRLEKLSLLYQVLSQAIIPDEVRRTSPKRLILQPALDFLVNHYDDPGLNNNILARKAYISEAYFRKIFKDEYGLSPKQYIQNIRINKAKELLGSEYLSVTSISAMVGYASIYHFSKAFRAQTGCTPTEYADETSRNRKD